MPPSGSSTSSGGSAEAELCSRLRALGQEIGSREAPNHGPLQEAWRVANRYRALLAEGLEAFHSAAAEAGAPQLQVTLSGPRLDAKHLRAVELELSRGCHRAVLTVKSRGEVTLVGPFRVGKKEGPCLSFLVGDEKGILEALTVFLEQFLEQAATP